MPQRKIDLVIGKPKPDADSKTSEEDSVKTHKPMVFIIGVLNTPTDTTVNNYYLRVQPEQGVVVAFVEKDRTVFKPTTTPMSAKTAKTIERPKSSKHAFSSTTTATHRVNYGLLILLYTSMYSALGLVVTENVVFPSYSM